MRMGKLWQMEQPWYLIELLFESGELMVNRINCGMKLMAFISTKSKVVLRNYGIANEIQSKMFIFSGLINAL